MKSAAPKPRRIVLAPAMVVAVACMAAISFCKGMAQYVSSPGTMNSSPRLVFEVATVKPNKSVDSRESISVTAGGNFVATATLKNLIERAYGLRDFQIAGGPKWINSVKYDVVAKSDELTDPATLTPSEQDAFIARQAERLQSLLGDRFHLRVHPATKIVPVYALVVAKGGPKLQAPNAAEAHRLYTEGPGKLACFSATMSELADELPDVGVERNVIDKTGINGNFDFMLHWAPEDAPNANDSGGSIFTALQEQLGLKLISEKAPVKLLIIDTVEQPSGN